MKKIHNIRLKDFKETNYNRIKNRIQYYLPQAKKIIIKIRIKSQKYWILKQLNWKIRSYLKGCKLLMAILNHIQKDYQLDPNLMSKIRFIKNNSMI